MFRTLHTKAGRGTRRMSALAALAAALCLAGTATAGGPPNDDCIDAIDITGEGLFSFSTIGATTGPEGQQCADGGTVGIENDVWFCWTATCSGTVTIETCGLTQFDTKIAVYDGCGCPDKTAPLCCNDNACDDLSQVVCDVVCGRQYMIQIGNPPNGTVGGDGRFSITCNGDPCDEPCCVDFNDGTTNGFGPDPVRPNVEITVAAPGPSGDPDDFYLRIEDRSGPSLAVGTACTGDWTEIAQSGCGALCFDFRIFEDGCTSSNPDCVANGGYLNLPPRIGITNGTISATFVGSFTVTDDDGPDSGWVHVCAPIGPLDANGNLPNNDDGAWVMGGGAPNSDWTTLISNVTELRLPIDFTANPAEIAGYDNICITEDECPCLIIEEEEILCDLGADGQPTGTYTITYSITNFSGVDAQYVLIPDAGVSPNVITLNPPLPGDGSASQTVSVTVTNGIPGELHCFTVILADAEFQECCASELCVELPDCECMLFSHVAVECAQDGTGGVMLSLDITNLTPDVVEHLFLIPQPVGTSVTIDPAYVDVPTMNPYTTQSFGPFTINGANPGDVICIRISMHNEDLGECCSQDLCFTVPDCSTAFSPCDLNQSGGVDLFDLLILLDHWGDTCPPDCQGDANNDGVVDLFDLLLILDNWST